MATKIAERNLEPWENIDASDVAEYLAARSGWRLGAYPDGSLRLGTDVGREIAEDDRPLSWIECPGIENIDLAFFRRTYVGNPADDDATCIRNWCRDGDMSDQVLELRRLVRRAAFGLPMDRRPSRYWM